MVRVRLV
ncbi:unnamed protein product, partial [Didymodactylos carnosus]